MRELSEAGVVWSDEHLLVLEKPAGLLCVPGRGADKQDCQSARVQRHFLDAMIVHRLDMATSGLWLMARGAPMQRQLSRAFAQRQVSKRYLAVVQGLLESHSPDEWSLIDLPIAADWANRPLRVIDSQAGKQSRTRWRSVADPALENRWGEACSRVELEPVTGRSHQLRLHLQALGHPMLGDAWYAPPEVRARAPRLLLHASQLSFEHPLTGQLLVFTSPAPF